MKCTVHHHNTFSDEEVFFICLFSKVTSYNEGMSIEKEPPTFVPPEGQSSEGGISSFHYTIKPDAEEAHYIPEGTKVAVQMDVEDKDHKKIVKALTITAGEGQVTLADILPEGHSLVIDPTQNHHHDPGKKVVSMNGLTTLESVSVLLHEAGHAHDLSRHPLDPHEVIDARCLSKQAGETLLAQLPDDETRDHIIAKAFTRERNAWAEALQINRKTNLPFAKLVQTHAQEALGTYDVVAAYTLARKAQPEHFASSQQRKALRLPEKKMEAEQLHMLEERVQQIAGTLAVSLHLSPDVFLQKAGDYVEFHDATTGYAYEVKLMGRHGNHIQVIERKKLSDGKQEERMVYVEGRRYAGVRNSIKDNGQEEVTFEGGLAVLVADRASQNPSESFQYIQETLDRLSKKSAMDSYTEAASKKYA